MQDNVQDPQPIKTENPTPSDSPPPPSEPEKKDTSPSQTSPQSDEKTLSVEDLKKALQEVKEAHVEGEKEAEADLEDDSLQLISFSELAKILWHLYKNSILKFFAAQVLRSRKIPEEIIAQTLRRVEISKEHERLLIPLLAKLLKKWFKIQVPLELVFGILMYNVTQSYITAAVQVAAQLQKESKSTSSEKKKRGRPPKTKV